MNVVSKRRFFDVNDSTIAGVDAFLDRLFPTRSIRKVLLINPPDADVSMFRFDTALRGRYTNYQQMLDQEGLDLVSICTHAPFHMPLAVAAAERGINVLSEKPLAVDLVQADKMLSVCTRAGVHLAVSHQFRFTPIFRQVKRWVDDGKIGQLRSIREVGKGREAGFELMEMGVHYFDEIDFFLGEIGRAHV